MAKKLELNFSSSKDAEIVRFIQLNTDENTSPIFICALEYNIKTGKFLNIGKVCTASLKGITDKVRKPIYVPNNSIVAKWADSQKEERKGLLTSKVRYILKKSIQVVESESDERVEEYMDLLMKVEQLKEKIPERAVVEHTDEPQEDKVVENVPEVVKETPQPVTYIKPPDLDFSDLDLSEPTLEDSTEAIPKKKNRGAMTLDKMMPVDF